MEDNEKLIDQGPLAQSVSDQIHFEFKRDFLVKPLDPIKVKKEFSKPAPNGEATTDKNDVTAVDYDSVETEVKEVDSDYREGVVLKVPFEYSAIKDNDSFPSMKIMVGDVIVFRARSLNYFDLLKDTVLVSSYDIICKKTND